MVLQARYTTNKGHKMNYEVGTKVIVPINGNLGTVVKVERNGLLLVSWTSGLVAGRVTFVDTSGLAIVA